MENEKCLKVVDKMEIENVGGGEDDETQVSMDELKVVCQEMEEEQNLRNHFPEETWMKILSKLDPETKENCANAAPYFRKLLLVDQRVVYLFPKVIELIAPIFEGKRFIKVTEGERDDGTGGELEVDAGEWKKTVLNCRLVCSTWNKAIESRYEKPEMTGIPEFLDELDPRAKWNNVREIKWTKQVLLCSIGSMVEYFNHHELPYKFLERFEGSHHSGIGAPIKNPFLERYLTMKIESASQQMFNGVNQVMETFGKEIWYLELRITVNDLHLSQILRRWLGLVPNLKYLFISRPTGSMSARSLNKIANGTGTDVCLPKLEKLQVLCMADLGATIGSELVRKNCHVTHLKICDMEEFEEDVENSLEMPNLQGFETLDAHMNTYVRQGGNKTACGDNLMRKLGPGWRNLKKLCYGHKYIPFKHRMQINRIGAPEAFAVFQRNWADTLTDLHLVHPFGFDEEMILEQSKSLRLNLTGVRKFTLSAFRTVFLNFALTLGKSLEHLELQLVTQNLPWDEYRQRVEAEQDIQLFGFEDKMNESNIWDFFEAMKTVKVKLERYIDISPSPVEIYLFTKDKEKLEYFDEN